MEDNFEIIESENDTFSNDDLFNITSWGADMTLREIISSYEDEDFVKPELQRKYVWDKKEASRFIESILLGLPVPSIFLANSTNGKKLIVDGYQRIMTIFNYSKGIWSADNSEFRLTNSDRINERWRGCLFSELSVDDQRRFRLYTIHAIIFEQKNPRNDNGLYQIFERINTSGKSLNPQEIRNCVYQGRLNDLLFKLNKNEHWRILFGDEQENSRMLDLEFILRYFALSQPSILSSQVTSICLKRELNDYMSKYISAEDDVIAGFEAEFNNVIDFIYEHFGDSAFHNLKNDLSELRKKFYPTIFDSLMIATKIALKRGYTCQGSLEEKRIEVLKDLTYRNSITQGTMSIQNIKTRIQKVLEYVYNINQLPNE